MLKKLLLISAVCLLAVSILWTGQAKAKAEIWILGFGCSPDEKESELCKERERNLAKFEEMHPDVKLKMDDLPGGIEKLLATIAAGTPPDVFNADFERLPLFIENEALLDIMPLVKEDPDMDLGIYFPKLLAIHQFDDKLYGLPNDFTPLVIYYNKDMFNEAGLDYPKDGWTWEDFLATAKGLTRDTDGDGKIDQYGFLFSKWFYQWIPWVWQNDADVLSPDGAKAEGYTNSPETVEAITFFTDLLLKHKVAPTPTDWTAMVGGTWDKFLTGRVGMVLSGHWSMVGLQLSKHFNLETVGVVGLPQNKKRVTVFYESNYSIPATTKYPKEAYEFIKYWTGPEVQKSALLSGIAIPGVIPVAEELKTQHPNEVIFNDEVQYMRAPWGTKITKADQLSDILSDAVEQITIGGVPVQKALDDAAKKLDREFAK